MSSANQLYKSSGSTLPFKEWLKREQLKGSLKVEKKEFVNATGSSRSDGEDEMIQVQASLAAYDMHHKDKYKKGLFVGVVVGVVGKILFDKFYKRK